MVRKHERRLVLFSILDPGDGEAVGVADAEQHGGLGLAVWYDDVGLYKLP